jgi:hypothetical protein
LKKLSAQNKTVMQQYLSEIKNICNFKLPSSFAVDNNSILYFLYIVFLLRLNVLYGGNPFKIRVGKDGV